MCGYTCICIEKKRYKRIVIRAHTEKKEKTYVQNVTIRSFEEIFFDFFITILKTKMSVYVQVQ